MNYNKPIKNTGSKLSTNPNRNNNNINRNNNNNINRNNNNNINRNNNNNNKVSESRKILIDFYINEKNSLGTKHENDFTIEKKKIDNNEFKRPYTKKSIISNNIYDNNNSNSNKNWKCNIQNLSDKEIYNKFGHYSFEKKEDTIIIFHKTNASNKKINIKNFDESIIGFPNIGNSCYINSFLQILLHTPNFLKILYKHNINEENSLTYNLINLSEYPLEDNFIINIKKIMGEINQKYNTYSPGDSQHFGIDFIDTLISECKNEDSLNDSYCSTLENFSSKIKKTEQYNNFKNHYNRKDDEIEELFQFSEVSSGSKPGLYSFSIYLHIELIFPPNQNNKISLTELLDYKYQNNKNNSINKNKIKAQLADLPKILIISFDRGVEKRNVIKTKVSFKENLNLEPYIDKQLIADKNIKYQLYAINERYGKIKSQGHYVSFIKIKNQQWYRFSDIYVEKCEPDFNSPDVFGLYYQKI